MKPILACDCSQGQANVQNLGGHESCGAGIGRPLYGILVDMKTQGGDDNGINLGTDVLNQDFFEGKFNDENALDRWLFGEGLLTDYDSPVVDPNTEDIADGRTFVLNENSKEVTTSIITKEYATLAAKYKAAACREIGWFFIDDNKSLLGHLKSETLFAPRKIQAGSFKIDTIEPTTGNIGRVQLRWKWDSTALDTEVDYITKAAMDGYDIANNHMGLIDISIFDMIATTGALQFDLRTDYGGAIEGQRIGAGGLSELNLEIHNFTDDVGVPVDDITETTTLGRYIATYTGVVASGKDVEVRGLSQIYVQKRYDLKNLIGKVAATP